LLSGVPRSSCSRLDRDPEYSANLVVFVDTCTPPIPTTAGVTPKLVTATPIEIQLPAQPAS
jgi:hypothetical protein